MNSEYSDSISGIELDLINNQLVPSFIYCLTTQFKFIRLQNNHTTVYKYSLRFPILKFFKLQQLPNSITSVVMFLRSRNDTLTISISSNLPAIKTFLHIKFIVYDGEI